MPKSLAQRTIPVGNATSTTQPDLSDPAWAVWQAHIDAGNIGTGPGTTPEQFARHARNERVLLGPKKPRRLFG